MSDTARTASSPPWGLCSKRFMTRSNCCAIEWRVGLACWEWPEPFALLALSVLSCASTARYPPALTRGGRPSGSVPEPGRRFYTPFTS